MRVIAGTCRGMKLRTPEGLNTRPTQDRIKETLFNMIHPYLADCVFVDMFSGSGGIGIEALSRGARKAYFVENAKEPIGCIEANLGFTRLKDLAVVLKTDAVSALHHIFEKEVDIIFMDPPYDMGHEKQVLTYLKDMKFVSDDTMIIVEASLDTDFDYVEGIGFEVYKEKRYKTNKHVFIRRLLP
ncbi:MAG: 16S rRNA (guanine(966)-N(2))-methyltransferase RsmD [Lachnospiraceae bacterium]|nr:16S rRNA (guanine(966)-N(2))-methyltransferase RsmD [Lachnospiraceae bacterium]